MPSTFTKYNYTESLKYKRYLYSQRILLILSNCKYSSFPGFGIITVRMAVKLFIFLTSADWSSPSKQFVKHVLGHAVIFQPWLETSESSSATDWNMWFTPCLKIKCSIEWIYHYSGKKKYTFFECACNGIDSFSTTLICRLSLNYIFLV